MESFALTSQSQLNALCIYGLNQLLEPILERYSTLAGAKAIEAMLHLVAKDHENIRDILVIIPTFPKRSEFSSVHRKRDKAISSLSFHEHIDILRVSLKHDSALVKGKSVTDRVKVLEESL
jgi:hypothetical protein